MVPRYGVQIGIPIIGFAFATYWQDHYRNRPWYSQRTHWSEVRPHYRTAVVRDDSHGNSRGRLNTSATSHDSAPRTRIEPHRAAVVAARAHEVKPSRSVTQHRSVAKNAKLASHIERIVPTTHHAIAPRSQQARVSHAATSHHVAQPRGTIARHPTARPAAQQKKPLAKAKSDQNKHPENGGQH